MHLLNDCVQLINNQILDAAQKKLSRCINTIRTPQTPGSLGVKNAKDDILLHVNPIWTRVMRLEIIL